MAKLIDTNGNVVFDFGNGPIIITEELYRKASGFAENSDKTTANENNQSALTSSAD